MVKYFLTNKAVEDLSEIWNYSCDNWSERQADKYYYILIDNLREISKNPGLGKIYPAIHQNIMGYKAGRHIIFYRVNDSRQVEILRILHEQMDLKSRMSE